jgi:hypothetical protein
MQCWIEWKEETFRSQANNTCSKKEADEISAPLERKWFSIITSYSSACILLSGFGGNEK